MLTPTGRRGIGWDLFLLFPKLERLSRAAGKASILVLVLCGLDASPGAVQSAIASRAMLAIFHSVAQELRALASLPLATSPALTTSPGFDAGVETALPAKWNGKTAAGKGIASRPSVELTTQEIQVWIANAMMASRATSHGMAPLQ